MSRLCLQLALLTLALLPLSAQALQHICGNVYIDGDETFRFSRNDEVFICGDSESPAWTNIPINQKKYHISAALQKQGYYSPEFELNSESKLIVNPGKPTEVTAIKFWNAPTAFTDSVQRRVEEGRLTAGKLSELEEWTSSHLRSVGYPCPEVKAEANSTNGEIYVNIKHGPRQNIITVERPQDPYEPIYRRYDAFDEGTLYNQDLLNLTSQRIVLADLAQYAHFEVQCRSEGAYLIQKTALGPPRLLTFAIGSSTEEAVITKAQWKHTRLGDRASNLKFEVSYSPRKQQFIANSQLYLVPDWIFTYLLPEVSVTRESESSYEIVQRKFGVLAGHIEDGHDFRYFLNAGPYYNHLSTLMGDGPRRSNYISWEARAKIISHYYEYYQASPRKGYYFDINYISQRKGIGSELNADKLSVSGSQLFNFNNYDPPLHVFGFRFSLESTLVQTKQIGILPQNYRLFLGGDSDIRGFARKTIDNAGNGYITTAYLGLEWRFLQVLPFNLQPFVFADAAKVGNRSLSLHRSLLWSPGVGLRWASPIGSFRVTAAKGYVEDPQGAADDLPSEWVFFLSYGNEF